MNVVDSLDPDMVLCDVRMQGSSGLDLCLALRERNPERKVVMLSVYDDEQYLFQALRVGASGYLLKSISSDELVRQLELVRNGETRDRPGAGRSCGRHRGAATARRVLAGRAPRPDPDAKARSCRTWSPGCRTAASPPSW